jgi:hypothetical protein
VKVHYRIHKSPPLVSVLSQINPGHPISSRSILTLSTYLRLGLPSDLFASGFPINNTCVPFLAICATWPTHLILLDSIILLTVCVYYNFYVCRIIKIIKSRRMRWEGHVARMGEKRNAYRLLVGKLERKRPLRWPRRRCVDNIRMDLGEVGWGEVDWIGLAKDRNMWRAVVNSVLNLRDPWNAGKR